MSKSYHRFGVILLSLLCLVISNVSAQKYEIRTHAGKKQIYSWKDTSSVNKPHYSSKSMKNQNDPYSWAVFTKPLSNRLKNSLDSLKVAVIGTAGKQGNGIAYKLKTGDNSEAVLALLKEEESFVNSVMETADDKITKKLVNAISGKSPNDKITCEVIFNSHLKKDSIVTLCSSYVDSLVLDKLIFPVNHIVIFTAIKNIVQIASLLEVKEVGIYIEPKPVLNEVRKLLGIDVLQQNSITPQEPVFDFWLAGKNLTGEGVTVANDEFSYSKHVGFCEKNSLGDTIVRIVSAVPTKFSDYWGFSEHGSHTAGIIGGNGWGSKTFKKSGGVLNYYRGIAPKVMFTDYMTADVNNHSFADDLGYYMSGSMLKDALLSCHATDTLNTFNNVLAVAAANNGANIQYYNEQGYYSVYQSAKNPIVVGATGNTLPIKAAFSSMGPTRDGRIKPDVMASGTGSIGFTNYFIEIDSISIVNDGVKKTWNFNPGDPTFNDWSYDVVNPVVSGGIYSFTTGPHDDCYMFSQPITPQIVSSVNDTLLLRVKATAYVSAFTTMNIGIMLKRPVDAFAKQDNPWTNVSKDVPITGSWQIIRIPLTGDPLTESQNGGWVDGDILDRIRLDFSSPFTAIMSCGADNTAKNYVGMAGTSMASPVVAGVAALMMQKYGAYLTAQNILNGTSLNIHNNPMWNSTVKGILIHTATDMVDITGTSPQLPNPDFVSTGFNVSDIYTAGPDWATGWGIVNPPKAVEYTNANAHFIESSVDIGELKTYKFTAPIPQVARTRITLCWDDPAKQGLNDSSTAYDKTLINDLDVYAIHESTGTIVRPWTLYQTDAMHNNSTALPDDGLDPITPDMIRNNPAIRGVDTLNNVEVIDIDYPLPGAWKIVISGQKILLDQSKKPNNNQDFSLVFDAALDLSTPHDLSVVGISKSQINLSWKENAPGRATGFLIERATGSGAFSQIASVGSSVKTYNNTALSQNVKYRYRVRATDAYGYSEYSNIDSTTTYTNVAQGKTVTVSSFQTGNIATNAVDGNSTSTRWAGSSSTFPQWLTVDLGGEIPLNGCEIVFERVGTSGDCNDFKIETSNNNSTWTSQINLPSNTNTAQTQSHNFVATARYVRITIMDAPGTYWASMYEFRVFGSPCPSKPTGLSSTTLPDNQLKLSWQPSYKALTYTVKRSTTEGGPYYTIASGLTATSFSTTDLVFGQDYYFVVSAVNSAGTSANSAEYATAVTYETAPLAPTSLFVSSESNLGYTLVWKDNSNCENGFEVERRVYGTTNWVIEALVPANQTTYDDNDVQWYITYEYRVHAINVQGSSANTLIASPKVNTPTDLGATLSGDNSSAYLSWTSIGFGQLGYKIEVSTDGSNFSLLGTVYENQTIFTHFGLAAGMSYYYRVNAFNSIGGSGYSEVAYVVTPIPIPADPSNLVATANSRSQITLTWADNSSNESGFYIERAYAAGGPFSQIASVGANVKTYVHTGRVTNTPYWYRVQSYNAGGTSSYTNTATATTHNNLSINGTATALSQQTGNLVANAKDNSTTTRWAASSGTMPQWWKIDLGSSKTISEVEIMFERTGTTGDCNDFKIETSTDNTTWTSRVDRSTNTNTAQTQAYSFGTTARYVRITISDAPGTYWASMYEVRVFGK